MIRGLLRFVALAAASVALIGGVAQADEPVIQNGAPGDPGSATVNCRTSVPPQDDAGQSLCTATPGSAEAPGPAVDD
jgi:hypothetical protein